MKILISTILALLWATAAFGASTSIVANGKLVGAMHVMVAGTPYTVMFSDGSCIQIFANCNPARFAFHDLASARAAGQALLDSVIVGNFRQYPAQIGGCDSTPGFELQCALMTPYTVDAATGWVYSAYALADTHAGIVQPNGKPDFPDRDFTGLPNTLALWTPEGDTSPLGSMDFNGDGTSDVLIRTTSGDTSILLMNSSGEAAPTNLGNVTTDWTIMGSADFNHDGKSDILWRNSSGDMVIWLMNGASVTQGVYIGSVSMDWTIAAVRDFNGDGKADILWQDDHGALVLWMMNGTLLAGSTYLGTMPGGKVQ